MQEYFPESIIKTLLDCAMTCENAAEACLMENNIKSMSRCIELDRDCADICIQAARLLQRDSEIGYQYLVLCEEICRMCAVESRKYAHIKACKVCADLCERCADVCHMNHAEITLK